uniref:Beta-sarcoglycan n=1 Tax=Globodera rostochiensis TaxID=31243 RepID=A0A914HEB2_GLORO
MFGSPSLQSPQYLRKQCLSGSDTPPAAEEEGVRQQSLRGLYRHRWSEGGAPGEEEAPMTLAKDDQLANGVGRKEQQLWLAGLRRQALVGLFCWLAVLSLLALLLLVLHLCLISVLQISPRGMRSLRVFTYENIQTGGKEPAVHFIAGEVHLGKVVSSSGKVLGAREKEINIRGSRILIGAGGNGTANGTRLILQEGQCRVEESDHFQIRQPGTGKVLFSARNPPVGIDRRIKRISSRHIVTNKLRSPVDEELRMAGEDITLRGNERIRMEAKRLNGSANRIGLKTTDDGSIRLSARRVFVGSKWRSLPISSSPSLTASVDAFRVCLCQQRPKLFLTQKVVHEYSHALLTLLMMNKSTTNRDSADDPRASIVSKAIVGQRVLVNGLFGGVLRYLGAVAGKQGLFCGVELDQRVGKNDGTHEGVAYFECRPGHGIFAPTHKVQPEYFPAGRSFPTAPQGHHLQQKNPSKASERMTSSDAALPPNSSPADVSSRTQQLAQPPQFVPPPPLPMDWSLMSMGSTNSGGSAGHFNIFDEALMANSQVTYTVFDSDCMMLSDLELTDSTVLRLDEDGDGDEDGEEDGDGDDCDGGEAEEDEAQQKRMLKMMMMERGESEETKRVVAKASLLDRSVVLDGPTLNLALPVIGRADVGDEEGETPTPMVEMKTTNDFQRRETEEDRRNRNHLTLDFPEGRAKKCSDTLNMEELQKTSPSAQQNTTNNNGGEVGKHTAAGGLSVSSPNNNNNRSRLLAEREGERPRGTETQQKETPKRPRVSLFQAAPPPNPMRTKLPKPPSKSQMIMDQLKASIEAEKQRAKKRKEEAEEEKRKEEEEKRKEEEEKREEKKRTADAGGGAESGGEKILTDDTNTPCMEHSVLPVKEVKAKRLMATNPQQRPPLFRPSVQGSNSAPNQNNSIAFPRRNSRTSPSARPVLSSRENTSGTLKGLSSMSIGPQRMTTTKKSHSVEHVATAQKHPSGNGRNISCGRAIDAKTATGGRAIDAKTATGGRAIDAKTATPLNGRRKEIEDELIGTKQQLKHSLRTVDVLSVVVKHLDRKVDDANTKTAALSARLDDEAMEHERAIAALECKWKKQLQQADEERHAEIAQLEDRHSESLAQNRQQHQAIVKEYASRLQKLEKQLTERDKKHRMELAESTTQATNRLHKELESRKYELQMKGEELHKLRQENRELQFEVDKLPGKDAQIVKLEARTVDLRDEVNRLRQLEKKLLAQLDEYRHELSDSRAKADAMTKEKEVLEYQYQLNEQNGGGGEGTCGSQILTPRAKKGFVMPSPNYCVGGFATPIRGHQTPETQRKHDHLSKSCYRSSVKANTPRVDMSHSMDSSTIGQSLVSCYIQEGRSKPQNTPTKIYTPRDVLEVPDSSLTSKRLVNFDSTREDSAELREK